MFGIGPQELVVIVFLLLLVFGPGKLGSVAKDVGRWAYEARSSVEEFKEELASAGKGKDQDDGSHKEDQMSEQREKKEPPQKEDAHPEEEVSARTEQ